MSGIVEIYPISPPSTNNVFLIDFYCDVSRWNGSTFEGQTGVRCGALTSVNHYFRLQYIRSVHTLTIAVQMKRSDLHPVTWREGHSFCLLLFIGPISIKSLIQHLDGFSVTILERPT